MEFGKTRYGKTGGRDGVVSVPRSAPPPRRQKRVIIFSSMNLPRDPLCADRLDVRYFAACVYNGVYDMISYCTYDASVRRARASVNLSIRFDGRINGEKKLRSERTVRRAAYVIAVDDDHGSHQTRVGRPADGHSSAKTQKIYARACSLGVKMCSHTNQNMPSVVFAGIFVK